VKALRVHKPGAVLTVAQYRCCLRQCWCIWNHLIHTAILYVNRKLLGTNSVENSSFIHNRFYCISLLIFNYNGQLMQL
ncbi:hypothetical protein GBAR_LOCUS31771, partial [Geodia barretti]